MTPRPLTTDPPPTISAASPSRLSFGGAKWFEVLPDDDSLARAQGDTLVNASHLRELGVEIEEGVDYDIERRFRLFTMWDVFLARNGTRVVFFGDRHPEYKRHEVLCVFDGGRVNTSAASTTFDTVPATALECELAGDATTVVLRSPRDRIESPAFEIAVLRERARAARPARARRLSMWTMVLNQETLIVPWIEYYLLMGVQHFYVYDHGCEDETLERLAAFVARGVVTVVDWRIGERYQHWGAVSWLYAQMAAMNHFLVRFGGDAGEWVGMLDVDEFVFFPSDANATLYDNLLATSDEACAGVAVRCRFFGGRRATQLPEDFLPRFMHLAEAAVEVHGYEKVFVRPQRIQWRVNIHSLVRERLCVAEPAHAHMQHYWWNRARPTATVVDKSFWQRYGAHLERVVDASALKRSQRAQKQWFSL